MLTIKTNKVTVLNNKQANAQRTQLQEQVKQRKIVLEITDDNNYASNFTDGTTFVIFTQ